MILYCPKCGWKCGEMPSILDNPAEYKDKDHVCKSAPSAEEQAKINPEFPVWVKLEYEYNPCR